MGILRLSRMVTTLLLSLGFITQVIKIDFAMGGIRRGCNGGVWGCCSIHNFLSTFQKH